MLVYHAGNCIKQGQVVHHGYWNYCVKLKTWSNRGIRWIMILKTQGEAALPSNMGINTWLKHLCENQGKILTTSFRIQCTCIEHHKLQQNEVSGNVFHRNSANKKHNTGKLETVKTKQRVPGQILTCMYSTQFS
jgi:hypothetical protein